MRIKIIIPCYNEAKRLNITEFEHFLSNPLNDTIDFIFVNDGSSDDTIKVLNKLCKNHRNATVLDLKQNVGKAEAIRRGVLESELEFSDFIGYFDADLATPLNEINRMKFYIENKNTFLIMGSRIKILGVTNIKRDKSRHYIGRIFATIVSNMLKLPIYDTQCGAKLIRKDIALEIFKDKFISKWLFDVELLFRLKRKYKNLEDRIIEVPLKKWEDVAGSKIGFSYFLKAPIDLLRIYFHYK